MIVTSKKTGVEVKILSHKGKPIVTKRGMVRTTQGQYFDGGFDALISEVFFSRYIW